MRWSAGVEGQAVFDFAVVRALVAGGEDAFTVAGGGEVDQVLGGPVGLGAGVEQVPGVGVGEQASPGAGGVGCEFAGVLGGDASMFVKRPLWR